MNRLTRRIGDASARRPWVTIAAWVAALALVLPLAGLVGGSFVDDLVAPGSQRAGWHRPSSSSGQEYRS